MNPEVNYPVYRKYKNDLSWFRISGPDSFDEIRKMGSRYLKSVHTVRILPERVMLQDLLYDFQAFAVEIDADEYHRIEALTSGD